jgi:transcriptional regulator with XRE-family HTH domain
VLGTQIALARRERGWTAQELAERAGTTARTISGIERGTPSASIGLVFETATLLGVPLFGVDARERAALARRGEQTLALLPTRVYHPRTPVRDDF